MTRVAVVADSAVLRAGLSSLIASDPGLVLIDVRHESAFSTGLGLFDRAVWGQLTSADPDVVVWAPSRELVEQLDGAAGNVADDSAFEGAGDVRMDAQRPDTADGFDDGRVGDSRLDDTRLDDARSDGDFVTPALVVFVDVADARVAARALAAGAGAVVTRTADAAEVLAVVQAVAAGLSVLPRGLVRELLGGAFSAESATSRPVETIVSPLTPREQEVLALLAQGLANKAIAPKLGISEHTVKAHVAAIYEKLGAGNRAEAVVLAARRGLLML